MKNIWNKGVCDPHIYIFNDKAYMYASHDLSADSKEFVMPDWWIWSSDDLVDWKLESVLKPEETYIGHPLNRCFATDAVHINNKYYWVFSDMSDDSSQIGLMESTSPAGPWHDPISGPLVAHSKDHPVYDPAFYQENGKVYLIFGAFQYYIAQMKEDMTGLAEEPRPLVVQHPEGPYGQSLDDKPYLHRHGGFYYLSWGCFYAMSRSLYGPYTYAGCLIDDENVSPSFRRATWPHGLRQGRHGNFFEWHHQWYFTYCDMSGSGNRYFRDSWISYLHYRKDGRMAPILIEDCGVGQYFAEGGPIPAVHYFAAEGIEKQELPDGRFAAAIREKDAFLTFPNLLHCPENGRLTLHFAASSDKDHSFIAEISCGGHLSESVLLPAESRSAVLNLPHPENGRLSLTLRFPESEHIPLLLSLEITPVSK